MISLIKNVNRLEDTAVSLAQSLRSKFAAPDLERVHSSPYELGEELTANREATKLKLLSCYKCALVA